MNLLPPIPPVSGLHPIVVHFPIALLLVAPVFVVLGLVWRRQARMLFVAAVVVLALGAAGAAVATLTGEEAGEAAERMPGASAVLERHEDLAELARNLFAGLAVLGVALAAVYWRVWERAGRGWVLGVAVLFLALHAGASLVLVNAAHEGGRLVHELGVRAPLGGTPAPTGPGRGHERDEASVGGRAGGAAGAEGAS